MGGRPGNLVLDRPVAARALRPLTAAACACGNRFRALPGHAEALIFTGITPGPMPRATSASRAIARDVCPRHRPHHRAFLGGRGRCPRCGFTGAKLHDAHGLPISLSPSSRSPMGMKLDSSDFREGGLSMSERRRVAGWLDAEAIDLLAVSGGTHAPDDGRSSGRSAHRRAASVVPGSCRDDAHGLRKPDIAGRRPAFAVGHGGGCGQRHHRPHRPRPPPGIGAGSVAAPARRHRPPATSPGREVRGHASAAEYRNHRVRPTDAADCAGAITGCRTRSGDGVGGTTRAPTAQYRPEQTARGAMRLPRATAECNQRRRRRLRRVPGVS